MYKSLSLAWPCLGAGTVLSVRQGFCKPFATGAELGAAFPAMAAPEPRPPPSGAGTGGGCHGVRGEKAVSLSIYWALVLTHVDTPNLPSVGYVIPNFPMGETEAQKCWVAQLIRGTVSFGIQSDCMQA